MQDAVVSIVLNGGVGADISFYRTPDPLQSAYGGHPVSFHLFFRWRPPAGAMGPMWNMRMSQPMAGLTRGSRGDPSASARPSL